MDLQEKLNLTPEQLEALKKQIILQPLKSSEELRDWVYLFLGMYMPLGHVYGESNSSSVESMWEVYCAVRENTGNEIPGYTLLSSRDSYKTLSASILEILLMIHFRTTIAHAAAIESQSKKAVEYCSSFLNKVMPYLKEHGWTRTSQNKRRMELTTDKGELCYIQIIILTMQGANCISPNTIIHMNDGTTKKADLVNVGDRVITWDYMKNKDVEVEVEEIGYTNKPSREIVFKDGSNIVLSDDHMVFTQRGWVTAANLRLTDKLKRKNCNNIHYTKYVKTELNHFSRDFEQMIIGTVLGDATIQKIPSGKYRYKVFHCEKQLTYLEETQKVLRLHNIPSTIIKEKNGYTLFTKTHPIFKKYYDLFYINGKKTPLNALPLLDIEGISYWFMDDARGNYKQTGKRKDHCFELATCCFTYEENQKIVDYFSSIDLTCKVSEITNQSKKRYPIIKFDLPSSRALSTEMELYFVNDIKYKLLPDESAVKNYRTVDKDELVKVEGTVFGFQWSDRRLMNSQKIRNLRPIIKKSLSQEIECINIIGRQNLIDLKIRSEHKHLHTFYANNILIHNSEHTNLIFIDEIDLCDPKAYQEAKMIPGTFRGRFPITVRLSTRKFAFGLMEKEIQNSVVTGEKVLRWNILDVTEHCPASRCLPNQPKQIRYIPRELPLRQKTEEEFSNLEDKDKDKWERIEAYQGCTKCPLLSVCKRKLHEDKPKDCVGDLWKPIDAVINVIRQVDPDVGEAQLLCHKPSSKGLIYPRFSEQNVVTVQQAWQMISGLDTECNFETLIQYLKDLGVKIEAGVDWGYTNEFSITVAALMPGGNSFVLYNFAAPGLELDDCVKIGLEVQERFGVQKWWADQAYPAYIKTFNKKGLKCPKFDKDVPLGIEAVRGRLIDSMNNRWMYIIKTEENQRLIDGFGTYHWKLDAQGNPTDKPDHTEESDIMDSVRYLYQNAYGSRKQIIVTSANGDERSKSTDNSSRMRAKIDELAINKSKKAEKKKAKRILWS